MPQGQQDALLGASRALLLNDCNDQLDTIRRDANVSAMAIIDGEAAPSLSKYMLAHMPLTEEEARAHWRACQEIKCEFSALYCGVRSLPSQPSAPSSAGDATPDGAATRSHLPPFAMPPILPLNPWGKITNLARE